MPSNASLASLSPATRQRLASMLHQITGNDLPSVIEPIGTLAQAEAAGMVERDAHLDQLIGLSAGECSYRLTPRFVEVAAALVAGE